MTTIEHALLGTNLVLATGLEKKFGWQTVALGGVCAVVPDWDGLSLLWSISLFDVAHRVWGHNLLICSLVALFVAAFDYRYDFITRTARQLVQWTKFSVSEDRLTIRTTFSLLALVVWFFIALIASWSHLIGDLVFSGTATLTDWDLKLLWPFADTGFIYPLISWGDVGVTIIFIVGMFAMLRWKNKTALIAHLTLLAAICYIAF